MSENREHGGKADSCKGAAAAGDRLVKIGRREPAGAGEGDATRRDFLSLLGFSVAAASMPACRAPEQRAIPLPVASEDMVAGIANYYATTCGGCASACSLLVKQRDGRPIKIDGNAASALFGGATCATGQAAVLSLYDGERLRGPAWQGKPTTWKEIDDRVQQALTAARAGTGAVVLLSSTITSPSLRAVIDRWSQSVPRFRHVTYDPVSASALRAATAQASGRAAVPHYAFDRARVIVGLEADFLGTWLSPVEFARQYARGRTAAGAARSLHVQFEAGVSVTGSNADRRVLVPPSELGAVAAALLARVAEQAHVAGVPRVADPIDVDTLDDVAAQLWAHRGESLVVSGHNDIAVQLAVHALNHLLGNLGHTVDLARPSLQRQGDDAAVAELVDQMERGEVHTLILHGVNPVYDHADGGAFARGLKKVALSVSTGDRIDETGAAVNAICPDHHFLESWGDAEPVEGTLSLSQPTIAPLFETRSAAESLLRWLGDDTDHYAYLRSFWREHMFPRQQATLDFDTFWDKSLEQGIVELGAGAGDPAPSPAPAPDPGGDWRAAIRQIGDQQRAARAARHPDRYELALFESVALRDGRHANNPWLQELPDPMTRITWGNVAAIAPSLADQLGVDTGDVVVIASGAGRLQLPVFVQPGQQARTISVALGHGRTRVGKAGDRVGANAFPLARLVRGARSYSAAEVTMTATGRHEKLAASQSHLSMEGRELVLETTLADLARDEAEAREPLPDLWTERPQGAHSWGMAIDLDACTGCSACVIACQAENNVPVV
ncbi:MAG TPA: hypothetical protein VKB80_32480, partial [Kofleriaceae bacterium]|nr:hypothetical protein [Kofleriaceae bacterium]